MLVRPVAQFSEQSRGTGDEGVRAWREYFMRPLFGTAIPHKQIQNLNPRAIEVDTATISFVLIHRGSLVTFSLNLHRALLVLLKCCWSAFIYSITVFFVSAHNLLCIDTSRFSPYFRFKSRPPSSFSASTLLGAIIPCVPCVCVYNVPCIDPSGFPCLLDVKSRPPGYYRYVLFVAELLYSNLYIYQYRSLCLSPLSAPTESPLYHL
jgi:hypothetical protein